MTAAVGIDVGTTNVKAVLVDGDGVIQASTTRPLQTIARGDSVTQDAGHLWEQVQTALAFLTRAAPATAASVGSIGVCSQYSSIVPVGPEGQPVGPMVLWQDRRGTTPSFAIMERHPDAFVRWVERHGIPPVGGGLALGHLLVLEGAPDRSATKAYLEAMDYVVARLTGTIAATQHSMFMSQLCDNRTLGATAYDGELLAMAAVDPERLPPLVPVGTTVGTLKPALAERLGLPARSEVSAGTNDTSTDAVAAGALAAGRCGVAIGTTSVLVDTVEAMNVDLDHEILSMPGPFLDQYLVWAENGLGGRVVQQVLASLIQTDDALGADGRERPFALLDTAVAASAPGANGVLCLPWFHGSLAPQSDPSMRGGFLNVSLETTRTDLVRAAVEATAHNLRWLLPHVESFVEAPLIDAGFVGGAARSDQWCQILADVVDRPVHRIAPPEQAVARGAALLAWHHQGLLDRHELGELVDHDRTFEPDPSLRRLYEHRHGQFEAAFDAVRPIVAELASTPKP